MRVKLTPVAGFSLAAIGQWAKMHLAPGTTVRRSKAMSPMVTRSAFPFSFAWKMKARASIPTPQSPVAAYAVQRSRVLPHE